MTKNLVIIMSDEHNMKVLGSAGHPLIKTPALDKLAAEGTRFTSAYCTSPICVPSRAGFATGLYTYQNHCWDNAFPYDGTNRSWGHDLIERGHDCVSIGKLHYRNETDPTGFSQQINPMHVIDGVGDLIGCIRTDPVVRIGARKYIEEAKPGVSTYQQYDIGTCEEAIAWLKAKAESGDDKGWMLFVSLVCPHFPLTAPQELMDLYPEESIPLPPQFDAENHPAIAEYARLMNFSTPPFTPEQTRRAISAYYALVTFIDGLVGRIVDAVDSLGLAEDTAVIYTSDHGDNLGRNGVFGKSTMFEDSVGVPLIMRGPGIAQGATVDAPVSHVDIYPTVLDIVGGGIPDPNRAARPGVSLLSHEPAREVIAEYHATCSTSGIVMLRKDQYKYVHYITYPPQLFDLAIDPDELNDVAGDSRYAQVLADMRAALFRILDPVEVDRLAKSQQEALVASHGGRESVLSAGALGYTPAPGEKPERI